MTLRAVIATAPVPEFVLSIADAAPVLEAAGATLDFALTVDVPFTGEIEVTYDTDTATALTQTVSFVAGAGTLSIPVINDEVDGGGDTVVMVTLTAATDLSVPATPVGLGTAEAEGVVTEDDGLDPADIDGDGILNIDDPFAYDGTNGDAKVLVAGGEFTQDFNTDTTNPFSAEGGFSGILVNPAFDYGNPADPAADPYGNRTNEAGVSISGGTLNILSTETDTFSTGTGPNNTLADGYQSAVDVTGLNSFEVHARASSADWLAKATTTAGFEQFGISLGAGGVDDFVKLVIGDNGSSAQRIQIAHNNSLTGDNDKNLPFGGTGPSVDLTLVGDIEFRLIVDRAAGANGQIKGQVDFFASADGALLESYETPSYDILGGSSLIAAMNGQNPLTGGDGGLAYGIFVTDWSGGGTTNQITANYDFLTIRALDEVVNAAPTVAAEIADQSPAEDALYSFAIPAGTFADDAGAGALVLTATLADDSALPAWLSFDGTSFSGTPLQADVNAGAITVKVTATDAQGESVSDEFTLTPLNVNDAPTIAGTLADATTTAGTATTVDLSGLALADEDGTTPTLVAVTQGGTSLPAGITLDGATINVADTTAEGVYTLDVFANDTEVNSDTPVSVTVTVGAPLNAAPTVAAEIADQSPAEDALYSFAIPAGTFADDAGAGALVLTATLADDSALPAWLSFDGTSFSGTPLQADVNAGAITVKVTATDAQGESVSDEFTLTPLNVNDAPTIAGTLADATTTAGTATTVDLSGLALADEDGTTPTLVAVTQGGTSLPAGITLDGATINVADTTAEGVYTLDVFANDTEVNSDTPVSVTVTVGAPLNAAPTVAAEIADQSPAEDALYSFTIPAGTFADDAGAGALTLSATLADDSAAAGLAELRRGTGFSRHAAAGGCRCGRDRRQGHRDRRPGASPSRTSSR